MNSHTTGDKKKTTHSKYFSKKLCKQLKFHKGFAYLDPKNTNKKREVNGAGLSIYRHGTYARGREIVRFSQNEITPQLIDMNEYKYNYSNNEPKKVKQNKRPKTELVIKIPDK